MYNQIPICEAKFRDESSNSLSIDQCLLSSIHEYDKMFFHEFEKSPATERVINNLARSANDASMRVCTEQFEKNIYAEINSIDKKVRDCHDGKMASSDYDYYSSVHSVFRVHN